MKKYIILLVFLIAFVLLTVNYVFAQTPSQLFQQALLKENGEGDLKSAVTMYEQIVSDETADRELRAKAQLHIGMCWEKMGKDEARLAYEKVLQNYQDQEEIVQQALERMKKIMKEESTKSKPIQPQYLKLLETDDIIFSADYSPNGLSIRFRGVRIRLYGCSIKELM